MTGNNGVEKTFSNTPCMECGMQVLGGEYHPFAACLMFKACHDGNTVRSNLSAVVAFGSPVSPLPDVAGDVEAALKRVENCGWEKGEMQEVDDLLLLASALRDLRQKMARASLPEGCPPTVFYNPECSKAARVHPKLFHPISGDPCEKAGCTELELHPLGATARLSERTEELTKAREEMKGKLSLEEIESIRPFFALKTLDSDSSISDKALKNIGIAQAILREIRTKFAALSTNDGRKPE